MAIRKGSSFKDRPTHEKTISTRAFEHALDIELMIVDRMEELGLRKKDLAKRVGMTQSGLANFLNGQPNMTLETMTRFEIALDAVFEVSLKPTEQYTFIFDTVEKHSNEHYAPSENGPVCQPLEKKSFLLQANQLGNTPDNACNIVSRSTIAHNKELCAA